MKWIKNLWPIGLLILVELILFAVTYHPGTYLAGWDGLYPELNFPINVQRNVFAVWQEYRGVGLYDGMSYASNLVHTLFIWLLSFVLPQNILRYFFIFLMHGIGMVSMYFLLKKLFPSPPHLNGYRLRLNALFGSLFYGLNLGIIQLFYAPLEVFAIHFAFLPILVLNLINYLQTPTRKNLLLFALFSLLATPQGYVPQIFISYLIAVSSILGVFIFYQQWNPFDRLRAGHGAMKQCLIILLTIFCMNAFWLLPYIYGIPHNAPVIMDSKINQMASPTIYQMNQNRGNLFDVLTLKGFMLDTAEFSHNQYGYIMQEWRSYIESPLFTIPSLVFIGLMLVGLFTVLKNKQAGLYPFVIIFGICFFFLGNAIPGLNVLNALLRWLLPIFNEAFRFPFTKFETLFVFSYTILLTYGTTIIVKGVMRLERTERSSPAGQAWEYPRNSQQETNVTDANFGGKERQDPENHIHKNLYAIPHYPYAAFCLLFLALFLYSLPAFTGHFLFDGVQVAMEPEYTHLIQYLNTQPQTARIATLPQPTFYNWEYHANNYRGSGFLWYGIPQATLERSFDPWSNYNENYYWELSQALYSHNADALKSVFSKYQVQYVLVDENQTYPLAENSLQIPQTKALLSAIGAKQIKRFGKVTLYTVPADPQGLSASPLFVADNLPTVNTYQWTDNDIFYQLHGDYIADSTPNFTLPFRSLFTNRPNNTFSIKQTDSQTIFSSTLPANTAHLILPAYTTFEVFVPGTLSYNKDTKSLSFTLQTPRVSLGNTSLQNQTITYPLATLPENPVFPLRIYVNNHPAVTLKTNQTTTLGLFSLPTQQNTLVTITDPKGGEATATLPKEKIQENFSHPVSIALSGATQPFPITITIPKVQSFAPNLKTASIADCTTLRDGENHLAKAVFDTAHTLSFSSLRGDTCFSFFDKQAESNQGYLLSLKSTNVSGDPLLMWAEDPSESFSFLYTRLEPNKTQQESDFVLPPREDFNLGYAIHLENISLGSSLTKNSLENISLSPIPYSYLTHIIADSGKNPHAVTTQPLQFNHSNPSIYDVTSDFSSLDNGTLVLSQAYNSGWKAYQIPNTKYQILDTIFPFFFGTELTNHVKVNNWENGWKLNQSSMVNHQSSIVIVFLPQYLEYLGFLILIGFCGYLLIRGKKPF